MRQLAGTPEISLIHVPSHPTQDEMDDLEKGQMAKLRLIASKARIRQGSKVLEIGCGWGSFAILVAREFAASVDTLTISEAQKIATEDNIRAAGVSDLVRMHLMDYRDMPRGWEATFDAVVSIGVTKHIGHEYLDTWFCKLSWAMKPENAFIISWLLRPTSPGHICSGLSLSSAKTLVNSITAAGLNVESIDDISPHYARPLWEWAHRFERNWDSYIKPAFKKHDPNLTDDTLEIFRKKWRYYLAYCEGGLALRCIYDHPFIYHKGGY